MLGYSSVQANTVVTSAQWMTSFLAIPSFSLPLFVIHVRTPCVVFFSGKQWRVQQASSGAATKTGQISIRRPAAADAAAATAI